jgi:predicted metal-dependent TIM-barrel fold hydrolase
MNTYTPYNNRKQMLEKIIEVINDPTLEDEDLQWIYDHLVGDEEEE